jgi:serine/threonine-protein kinase
MNHCPRDQGEQFLAGILAEGEQARFVEHLSHCGECQKSLEALSADEECWQSARELLCHSRSGGSAADVALPPAERDPRAPAVLPHELRFLAPSDDPAMIGRIGPYEIRGVLGRGGMGLVFKGFDRALHRNVAIKILSPTLASVGAARQRFAQEARAMAAITHEHVVPVYAVDEHGGLPYFVMEYVAGGTLEGRLARHGRLGPLEVVRIGLQVARGLEAAHAQGLVHRDIKPANVLLDEGTERVRVADFGLARVASDASLTHSGALAGTPYYMAPEQARGESADFRSDLFSLGSTLYAACAGHPPFRAETPLAVLRRVCDDEPRRLCAVNPDVPAWLETAIARLMAKEPQRRFQSAGEVASVFECCLAHLQQPLASPLPKELERGAEEAPAVGRRTWPGRWRAAVALALVAVVGTGLAWWRFGLVPTRGSPPPGSIVVQALADQSEDELQRSLDQLLGGARDMENELTTAKLDHPGAAVGGRLEELLRQAQALEQDLVSAPSAVGGPGPYVP